MQWQDEGVILTVRAHGETSAVIEAFTRAHGRHLGLVMGGRSRRLRPVLQPGNHVDLVWKARLEEHLGHASVELRRGFAAEAMESAQSLAALSSMAELLRLLPERDPHPSLYEVTLFVLEYLGDPHMLAALLVRWELALLDELGFGLDLATCALTGATEELAYVSPKSGRAVSAAAAQPYKDRLLRLPPFLSGEVGSPVTPGEISDGFRLSGHFLARRALEPRGQALPEPRERLVAAIIRARG